MAKQNDSTDLVIGILEVVGGALITTAFGMMALIVSWFERVKTIAVILTFLLFIVLTIGGIFLLVDGIRRLAKTSSHRTAETKPVALVVPPEQIEKETTPLSQPDDRVVMQDSTAQLANASITDTTANTTKVICPYCLAENEIPVNGEGYCEYCGMKLHAPQTSTQF